MELTKEYFDQHIKTLVSKKDTEGFATKSDLLKLATKDDLLELATKTEMGVIRSDISEVKALVKSLKAAEHEDTTAIVRDLVDLKGRVAALERTSSK